MAFVKLDCGILHSTLWHQPAARSVFVTALLMARPHKLAEDTPQLEVRSLTPTGWTIPAGWYGLIEASGIGIVHQAVVEAEAGLASLEQMSAPEPESRSQDFDGRRLARISGGYIVLNFDRYREKDHTSATRAADYRNRKRAASQSVTRDVTPKDRDVTQAEADLRSQKHSSEAEAELRGSSRRAGAREAAAPPVAIARDPRAAEIATALAASSRFKNLGGDVAEALLDHLGPLALQLDAAKIGKAIAAAALELADGATERETRRLLGWKFKDALEPQKPRGNGKSKHLVQGDPDLKRFVTNITAGRLAWEDAK
jgi:hypothetical protein